MTSQQSIEINGDEVGELIALLEAEALSATELGDQLILRTNNRQAGFNQHSRAERLTALAARLDAAFPEGD